MTRRALAACVLSGCLLAACHTAAPDETLTEAAVSVRVELATIGSIREHIAATGIVSAAPGAELTVTAPEAARIAALPSSEGEPVRAGDVIARFDIPSLQASTADSEAAIAQAEARVDNARSAAARLQGLVERGVAARKEAEDAERDLREALAALAQAQSARIAAGALAGRAVVRAPFAGVIAKRWHNPGDLVEPGAGDPVIRLVDPSRFEIVASVPVSSIARVPATATAAATDGAGATIDAVAIARPIAIDAGAATAPVRFRPTSTQPLIAGMTLQVTILGAEIKNAVLVPSAAVIHDTGGTAVMVVHSDSTAHRVEIETGLSSGDFVQVVKGLAGGERVIVRGQNALPDGAAVTIE